ncbi:EamA-like transporter family protein [Nocardia brasiliensis]|uniref:EamA-like transporter family protein n=1 Tax=Nocardia brasiliensis TaxID=37326 RepID=A0A6G9XJI1_NOCBR|nr:DMT family transporter [Nocardia brasiliensis]QIS01072.1 EamA-like transporter family protein [Nocardia brasiliensis]
MTGRVRVGLGCAFAIGAGVAVQGRINGALGARLQDGIAAATISFGSGLLVLAVVFVLNKRLRDGLGRVRAAVTTGRLPTWQLLGGLCGAFFVACQGLTVAAIGVTAFTVAAVAGQLLSSLVVDRLGVAPSGRTSITPLRFGAAALGIVAVLLAGLGRAATPGGPLSVPEALRGAPTVLLVVLPALAGIGLAWQQAVNGRVGAVGGPFSATAVNFGIGLVALVLIEAALLLTSGPPAEFPTQPWLYLGGVIGIAFIALAAVTVRWIGVLLLGLTSVAGQLVTSIALDVVSPTAAGLSGTVVLGGGLTLLAVAIAARAQP